MKKANKGGPYLLLLILSFFEAYYTELWLASCLMYAKQRARLDQSYSFFENL